MMSYKWCVATSCKNTSIKTPEKVFFRVPRAQRKTWLKLASRDPKTFSPNSDVFLCEDHFNLETDVIIQKKYKLRSGRHILKRNVVPHFFECNQNYDDIFKEFGNKVVRTLKSLPLETGILIMEQLEDIINTHFQTSHETGTDSNYQKCSEIDERRSSLEARLEVNEVSTQQKNKGSKITEFAVKSMPLTSINTSEVNPTIPPSIKTINNSPTGSPTGRTIKVNPVFLIKTEDNPITSIKTKKTRQSAIKTTQIKPLIPSSFKTIELTPGTKKKTGSLRTREINPITQSSIQTKQIVASTQSILNDHTYSAKPEKDPKCILNGDKQKSNGIAFITMDEIRRINEQNQIKDKNISTEEASLNEQSQLDDKHISKVSIKEEKNYDLEEAMEYYDYSTDTASSCYDDYESKDDEVNVVCKIEAEEACIVKSEPDDEYNDTLVQR